MDYVCCNCFLPFSFPSISLSFFTCVSLSFPQSKQLLVLLLVFSWKPLKLCNMFLSGVRSVMSTFFNFFLYRIIHCGLRLFQLLLPPPLRIFLILSLCFSLLSSFQTAPVFLLGFSWKPLKLYNLLLSGIVHRCGPGGSMRACHVADPGSIPGRDKFPGWGFFGVFFLTCKTNVGKL